MAVKAGVGYGSILEVDTAGGTSYTAVGNIVSIQIDGPEVELAEATHMSSTNALEEELCGMVEPPEITIEVRFDPDSGDEHDDLIADIVRRAEGATTDYYAFRITYPTKNVSGTVYTTKDTFDAWVTNVSISAPHDDVLSATFTLKCVTLVTRTTTTPS